VCTSLFNARRFRSRWKLYEDWARMVKQTNAKLCVIEVAFGEREFAITPEVEPQPDILVQVHTQFPGWLKENALNVLVQHLPHTWQYVAWVDADCHFARYDWANETIQQLQHHPVIQMWSQMADLNANFEMTTVINSFMANFLSGKFDPDKNGYYYGGFPGQPGFPGAPGLAWAATRAAWDSVGGLIDWGIVGAGDSYMAFALIGELDHALRRKFNPGYTTPMYTWERNAVNGVINKNIGCMPGLVIHYWHGPKGKRLYGSREQILVDWSFDPATDLIKDAQGIYQLVVRDDRQRGLRAALMGYARRRDEDALS
jgi:hypothetical protein